MKNPNVEEINHEAAFEKAWANSSNTTFELPPVDINQVLSERYHMKPSVRFTREMMWDVEVRKAWRPDRYIPSVVETGSAVTWGGRSGDAGDDRFLRASRQRSWLDPETYGLVLERCHINMQEQKVTFIGISECTGPLGGQRQTSAHQPLFHVEHAVEGEEDRPINRWRIVHLTDGTDPELIKRFEQMAKDPWLPEFVEIYLRDDRKVDLTRRDRA